MTRPRRRTGAGGELLESAFATQVEALLDLYGWRWFHAPDNRPVQASSGRRYVQAVRRGFPDYVALRGPELLVIELKAERGRLGEGQAEWLEAWRTFARLVGIAAAHTERDGLASDWQLPDGELVELGAYAGEDKAPPAGTKLVGRVPAVDVYLWRPSDLDAINERLSRGRHRLEYAG